MNNQDAQSNAPLNFNFGFVAFESVIAENFRTVQNTLTQQQAQIGRLSALLQTFQRDFAAIPKTVSQAQSIEPSKTTEIASSTVEDSSAMKQNSPKKVEQEGNSTEMQLQSKGGVIQGASLAQNQLNQTELSVSQVGVKLESNPAMEEKVFQLFERVRQLEEKQSNADRYSLKKFREVDFQLDEQRQLADKGRKTAEDYEDALEGLRNEISEYKLKKESKILKALNSSSIGSKEPTGNYDYMAEKLQFLLKHVSEMLTKRSFEEEREALHGALDSLRRKLNDNVTEGYFQEALKAQEARIYQSVAKHLKAAHFAGEKGTDQLDAIIEEGNREFTLKVSEHEQKIRLLNEDLELLRAGVESGRRERGQFEEECSEQFRVLLERSEALAAQLQDARKFSQEVKQALEQKHLESENQIIELQEALEKVAHNFKSLSFNRDTPLRTSYAPNDNPESQLLLEKANSGASNNVDLENDLKSQQKKFNKLLGKVQGLKEQILTFREDLMREIDGVKAALEKKADWQSLRKGLNFLEEKVRETRAVTQAVYESAGREQGGESLAVKKGWTCLMCDKDIKNYEGKLGELKFTSVFPAREAPRIGGYYKQQQANSEYRQLFLSNSNLNLNAGPNPNNRSRRIGSLKSKDSKEELH